MFLCELPRRSKALHHQGPHGRVVKEAREGDLDGRPLHIGILVLERLHDLVAPPRILHEFRKRPCSSQHLRVVLHARLPIEQRTYRRENRRLPRPR